MNKNHFQYENSNTENLINEVYRINKCKIQYVWEYNIRKRSHDAISCRFKE